MLLPETGVLVVDFTGCMWCAIGNDSYFPRCFMAAESPCIPGGHRDRQTASQAV